MTGEEKVPSDLAFLEYILKAIVDFPDMVQVTRTIDQLGVLLTVVVDAKDMGTIIGKNGKTANALRVLLRVIGAKENAHVNMKIVDTERNTETSISLDDEKV
ncbi:MAG: KH domain-containing protein [Candidatus Abawacabacteria bacterium]|nr:KH domain-containing protein [Candidatus Abawacabacteria bacterium]